jgi:hypothetical protein
VSTRLGDFILTKRSAKPTTKQKAKMHIGGWKFCGVHAGIASRKSTRDSHTNRFHITQIRVNGGMLQVRESHSVCSTT